MIYILDTLFCSRCDKEVAEYYRMSFKDKDGKKRYGAVCPKCHDYIQDNYECESKTCKFVDENKFCSIKKGCRSTWKCPKNK